MNTDDENLDDVVEGVVYEGRWWEGCGNCGGPLERQFGGDLCSLCRENGDAE